MPLRLCLALVLAVVTGLGGGAHAQGNRAVYSVPEVPVYAQADSAAAAQSAAQSQGRLRAMDILLRRLTAQEDWEYLPTLAEGTPAPALSEAGISNGSRRPVTLTAADVPPLELGFSIYDEKTSPRSYRAGITYRFKPDAVRAILRQAGLPFSESQARSALVLPVLVTDEDTYLWETKNPWARAWLARPLANELTPLILPEGDSRDMGTLDAGAANDLDRARLAEIANRYDVSQVLVARGNLRERGGTLTLDAELVDGLAEGRQSASQDAIATLVMPDASRGTVLAATEVSGPADDFPALAQRAVSDLVNRYATAWKARTLVDTAAERELTLTAWFGSLEEWGDIRRALESSPLVTNMDTGAFTNENAVIDLRLTGDQEQFALSLGQNALEVWQSQDGRWNVADASLAGDMQGRTFGEPQLPAAGGGGLRAGGPADLRPSGPPGRDSDDTIPTLPDDFGTDFGD